MSDQTRQLMAIKDVFYELLEAEPDKQDDSVQINQQMALQITRSVQEKGVVIIQSQSNVLHKQVIHTAIRGMRLIDDMIENVPGDTSDTVMIDAELPDSAVVTSCANHMLDQGKSMAEAKAILGKEMLKESLCRNSGNCGTTAKQLRIQRTYLSRLKSEIEKGSVLEEP